MSQHPIMIDTGTKRDRHQKVKSEPEFQSHTHARLLSGSKNVEKHFR
jgi:hypothetical protein